MIFCGLKNQFFHFSSDRLVSFNLVSDHVVNISPKLLFIVRCSNEYLIKSQSTGIISLDSNMTLANLSKTDNWETNGFLGTVFEKLADSFREIKWVCVECFRVIMSPL